VNDIRVRPLVAHNLLGAYQKPQVNAQESGFGALLKTQIQKVQSAQQEADRSLIGAVSGQETELHRVMIAQEEASLTFELMLEVRNKLVESYQQIMQMQI
jgi:flagellar hook-basal body complex protein FliE